MFIQQKSIRSVDRFLKALMPSNRVRLCFSITDENKSLAEKAGFNKEPGNGDTILPEGLGNTSIFNAEGRYEKLMDLPKEQRYITTIEWTWEQWCGRGETETITENRDIYRDCYQSKFVEPPALELTYFEHNGKTLIISQEFSANNVDPVLFKHAINLFLELFGECEIRRSDLSTFTPPNVKRVNWSLLPPGQYPWDKVQKHVRSLVKGIHSRYSNVMLSRQEVISRHEPDEVYIGHGGFRSYVAYVFSDKNLVILESVLSNNATYVFEKDWEKFSMLTKAEILNNSYQKARLIHSSGWEQRLNQLLT